jgi:hypothetical protein
MQDGGCSSNSKHANSNHAGSASSCNNRLCCQMLGISKTTPHTAATGGGGHAQVAADKQRAPVGGPLLPPKHFARNADNMLANETGMRAQSVPAAGKHTQTNHGRPRQLKPAHHDTTSRHRAAAVCTQDAGRQTAVDGAGPNQHSHRCPCCVVLRQVPAPISCGTLLLMWLWVSRQVVGPTGRAGCMHSHGCMLPHAVLPGSEEACSP